MSRVIFTMTEREYANTRYLEAFAVLLGMEKATDEIRHKPGSSLVKIRKLSDQGRKWLYRHIRRNEQTANRNRVLKNDFENEEIEL